MVGEDRHRAQVRAIGPKTARAWERPPVDPAVEEARHVLEGERAREVVALRGVTRGLEGPYEMIGGLDALDHDGETHCSTEFSDRGDEGPRRVVSKSSNVLSIFRMSMVSLISMPSDE
ncbi:MAG: hypothetical protein QOI16_4541 [Pseudonocardiales bacterium]|nr:hypothetical protein [Pseudonocardiales bacterium]